MIPGGTACIDNGVAQCRPLIEAGCVLVINGECQQWESRDVEETCRRWRDEYPSRAQWVWRQ